jgi:glycosyltransferase involved in cell wall biosynthesis
LRRLIRDEQPDVVLSMRVFDAYEAVALEKRSDGQGPRLAVGIRGFEAPYLADLARYRDSVDLCVTSGDLLARIATGYCGVEADRVVSIGGGVLAPRVPRSARGGGPLRLLYAGRLEEAQKRISDLPRLLEELDRGGVPVAVDIAGTGPAEASLREQLAARIAQGQVRMHGWLERDELYARLYPAADVFLHFAAWEGMTIAPREAMAHGVVPVITRFAGQQTEGQFRDGENALVFAIGAVADAAECIRRLAQEPGLHERLSTGASASQRGKYEFEGSMDAWAEAFGRCLLQPSKRGALPRIPDRRKGRLARLGLPAAVESGVRSLLRRPVQHQSPGSEWPTSSGLTTDLERSEIARFAEQLEAGRA